jgi:chromosome segregation ATPase
MTFTIDPGFIWQLIVAAFLAGGGWVALHMAVRWLEAKQDLKLDALKDMLRAELEGINQRITEHAEQYQKDHNALKTEHGQLRQTLTDKGESVTTLVEQLKQVEKRLDEKLDLMMKFFNERLGASAAQAQKPRARRAARTAQPELSVAV